MKKRNIVNTTDKNLALCRLMENKSQILTVDANFFIPPL